MQISKSDYLMFLKHPAWLWLKKHSPEKLPPVDDDLQAIFDAGFLFESYAEQLFPDATKLEYDRSDRNAYKQLTANTKQVIESGATTIIQGRFEAGDITCISDVLVKTGDKAFDLYEIKSTTEVKNEHIPDLSFQMAVIENNGYIVNKIYVIHVNNKYVRNGKVKASDITTVTEVTDKVKELRDETEQNIKEALKVIDLKKCPDISPSLTRLGAFGEWLGIYKTLANVKEYSIYNLCSPGASKIGKLEALGIKNIADIPDGFKLDAKQLRQFQTTKNDTIFVEKNQIKKFLSQLKFPLYFLDYETLSSVIPYFDGLGPYKQLPFQYSLHVLDKPNGEVKHFEYLHTSNSNPLKPLTETLKSQIGDEGTVLVWCEGFEKSCNVLMGTIASEYEKFYKKLNARIVDLMIPFSTGLYVHKDFFGSASIKKVLPVVIPDLSYKELDINAGGAAQRLWMEAVLDGKRAKEKDKILSDLSKYCELDTLAMVRIYQHLIEISGESNGVKVEV
ncbi:MAG: DUF2779 domain-containing protein [Candidatus Berkelbacteria bacterium]